MCCVKGDNVLIKINYTRNYANTKAARPFTSDTIVWLCAGHGTRLKGEPTISNYGSQGKSQAQPDGGEGHSVITTGYPVTVLRKAVAPLRRSNTKARGDEQKSSQACMSGTSPAGGIKTSIHYKQCPYTRRLRDERRVLNSPPSPTSRYFSIPFLSRFSIRYQSDV